MTEEEELAFEMKPNYDMSKGIRGAYVGRGRKQDSTLVLIEPDLFARFPSTEAVNEALRSVLEQREKSAA